MKKIILTFAALSAFSAAAFAQVWTDAASLARFGQLSDDIPGVWGRLPASLEGVAREPVWQLGTNSSGVYVRFRTDSKEIAARWTVETGGNMNHMAQSGQSGVDLYAYADGCWHFAGTGRPVGKGGECTLLYGLDGTDCEYMMYLPLYDKLLTLEIGVDSSAVLSAPQLDSPRSSKAVIVYGTSITQGGCASRPGMNFTSIMSRALDVEFVNLGFSGNGIIDLEIARAMAEYPSPAAYGLDWIGNATAADVEARGESFYRILRDAHPDVPIIFHCGRTYPYLMFNSVVAEKVAANVAAQEALFAKLKAAGEKNIYMVPCYDMTADCGEQTVDGTHMTDLGMMGYAKFATKTYRKVCRF